ncbi:DUF2218 domain-containing protein [Herbiconiux daphne]|uniref:DUF2218 domain-containing protein n=1 Tax=Herbiconiux daphne TaxID=2970914 RepID=A0ABT2H739_9MICO|nr:DUF2218 domain-containing protein [Herbiconiux daphne]MCS5735729.1 DUF2218 domain-containing protein [Herbiconiux daphne]
MTEERLTSQARVETARPDRYGRQLVKHLSRREGGEWDNDIHAGWVVIAGVRASVVAEDTDLLLTLEGSSEAIGHLELVVGSHLARFGSRDGLVVQWNRSNGTPGTRQTGD